MSRIFVKAGILAKIGLFWYGNIMKNDIPKAYEPKEYEDKIYERWEKSGFFNPDNLDVSENAESYTISMPPPNVTGNLHMGHAVMLALEDILIRYHRMKGRRALWVPGTDHAAIATQTKVEKIIKEEGSDRHSLGREKFLERVRQFAQASHDTIVNQVKKMGCSCDWSREAYTLDEVRTKFVRSVFKLMHEDGLIYRGERIVNWCPRCHSTLSDDEVEYKNQIGKLYTFKYSKDFPFAIATTRPETKLGDTAVAVHPDDKRYQQYIGKVYELDFVGVSLKLKIIADKSIDPEFGTGALGVTPAHSMVDWQMAEEHGLETVKVIDEDGKIRADRGVYGGMTVSDARKLVVARLQDKGLLEKEEEIENNLSICYRCDTPIEPLPSLQWFIDVNKKIHKYGKTIKELSVEAVRTGVFGREPIRIVPERFEKNYFHWMDNLRDWCISRQIWYGHQVPVWHCRNVECRMSNVEFENHDIVSINEVSNCPECGGVVGQDSDTLDTWFSSGLWTFSTLADNSEQIKIKDGKLVVDSEDFKKFHPTAVLETGYDILFFWVARMIIMTTYAVGDIPFQDVYLHGLIRDENGRKMSKSLGNVIDPLDMIAKYGTDATRLSLVIGTTPGNDMNLSEDKIAGYRNFVNKLWNISRYIIQVCHSEARRGEESRKTAQGDIITGSFADAQDDDFTMADSWILSKLGDLIKEVSEDLDNYRFSQAGERLREFTWSEFADWYLEASKFEKTGEKNKILNSCLETILKLWHPFMPFVTEVIWNEINKEKMLLIAQWPSLNNNQIPSGQIGSRNASDFESVKGIITAIRNARAEYRIKPGVKIKVVIYAGKKQAMIESQAHLIKSLRTGINELEVKDKGEKPEGAIYATVDGIEIYLIVENIDFSAERKRIEKETKDQEARIKALEKKLGNKEFTEKAPEKIVKQEQEKLKLWQSELAKLKEQLKNLQ